MHNLCLLRYLGAQHNATIIEPRVKDYSILWFIVPLPVLIGLCIVLVECYVRHCPHEESETNDII